MTGISGDVNESALLKSDTHAEGVKDNNARLSMTMPRKVEKEL
jgi:hypothetical protein